MSKKSINFTVKDIIALRDEICKTKTLYWRYIRTENVMSSKMLKVKPRNYDLNNLYNQILQLSEKLVKVKLMLQAINNGETKFDYEEAKKTHYYNIFMACEKKEQFTHWDEILKKATINPSYKAKVGIKGTGKNEVFSSAKITSIKKSLQLEINKYDAAIKNFNDTTTLEVTDDDFTLDVVA